METQTKEAALAGAASEDTEHVDGALDFDSTITREALLNRLCIDGGQTAAFALRALRSESPTLADPILEQFARYADEIDDLELRLLDHMALEARAAA